MKTAHSLPLTLAMSAVLVLAACGAPVPAQEIAAGGPQAWIDDPLSGQRLNLSDAPFEVIVHANDPAGLASFELEVNGQAYHSAGAQAGEDPFFAYSVFSWSPTAPGIYLLSAYGVNQNGEAGLSDSVEVTIVYETVATTPTATPEATVGPCTFTAAVDLFCRAGPSQLYEAIDSFVAGMMAMVVGESSDHNFWYVEGPNSGRLCTVPKAERFGTTAGVCEPLPAFTPMPLPTATPTPTATPCAGPSCP